MHFKKELISQFISRKILIAILVILLAFPFAFFLFLALAEGWHYPALFPSSFSMKSFKLIFTSREDLLLSFLQSLLIGLMVAILSTISGFICSKQIAYHKQRNFLLPLSFGAYILSPVIYASILFYFFTLFNLTGSLSGVIIAQFIIVFPFAVIFFSSFWNSQLKSLLDLVTTLGGNTLQQYTRLIFPLAKNVLLVCFFQTFLISWFEYGLTSFIGAGKINTLTLSVFEYVQEANPYYAALSSFLLVMPPLILLWANKKFVFVNDFALK